VGGVESNRFPTVVLRAVWPIPIDCNMMTLLTPSVPMASHRLGSVRIVKVAAVNLVEKADT
jgi:hypothetical protein